MKKYIIIGASAAALGALFKLRQLDKESEIICVSQENFLPYNKCLMADYLSGQISEEKIFNKKLDFFENNNIKFLFSTTVTKIDPKNNLISLSSNNVLKYNYLLLSTGTRAFVPHINGIENIKNIFNFHIFSDIKKILNFIKTNNVKSAAVIGAGLSGVECADALNSMNFKTVLIEKQSHIFPTQLDQAGARIIESRLKKFGVNLYTNESVQNIEEITEFNKITYKLTLSNSIIKTDLVIFASGNQPNIEIAQTAGIKIENNRILTNNNMQTNFPNIYAAGDVCLIKNLVTEKLIPSCTWPDATMQGMVAASNMAGVKAAYSGALITTSSNIFNTQFISCGQIQDIHNNSGSKYKIDIKSGDNFYHKFIKKNNKLVGFIMVGNVDNVGELKSQIIKNTEAII